MSSKVTRIYEIPTLELAKSGWRLDLLEELCDAGKLDAGSALEVELAIQEAVTNSLEHGNLGLQSTWKDEIDDEGFDRYTKEKKHRLQNPSYASRQVKITVEFFESTLDITIQDEGEGFYAPTMSPLVGLAPYGRGLTIIRSHMDEVTFEDAGRTIRMKKNLVGGHGA
jgi:anti-sigma regulatory factor (Ser/Thr protein kinase)